VGRRKVIVHHEREMMEWKGMVAKEMTKSTKSTFQECPWTMMPGHPLHLHLQLLPRLTAIHLSPSFARPRLWPFAEFPKSYQAVSDLTSMATGLPGQLKRAGTSWRPMCGRDWSAARGSYYMGQKDVRSTDHTNIGLIVSLIWAQEVVETPELRFHLTRRSLEDTKEVTKKRRWGMQPGKEHGSVRAASSMKT
jgi:hypothetical protein